VSQKESHSVGHGKAGIDERLSQSSIIADNCVMTPKRALTYSEKLSIDSSYRVTGVILFAEAERSRL
jgi:hypothetical protein